MSCSGSLWSDKTQVALSHSEIRLMYGGLITAQHSLRDSKHHICASGFSETYETERLAEIDAELATIEKLIQKVNKLLSQ